MKIGFSCNKDTDREILLHLPDKDLLSVSRLNKYFYYILCDDIFFYNKLIRSYPDILKYYDKGYRTYKRFYLTMISYIDKLQKEFNYSYVSGNPEVQERLFHYNREAQSLLYASILARELEVVKESVRRGAYIDGYDSHALKLAIDIKDLEMFKYAFEHEGNSHNDNKRLLNYAIENGCLEIVKYLVNLNTGGLKTSKLVKFGLNIDLHNDISLIRAEMEGHEDIVNYFIERGARIDEDGRRSVVIIDFTGV